MRKEIECRVIKINKEKIREKLVNLDAILISKEKLFKRIIFENEAVRKNGKAWIRLRDEGDKITLTYKNNVAQKIDGMEEIEIEVSDFQTAAEICKLAGLEAILYQENLREEWKLGEVDITIDSWPLIDPYIEIEGKSEKIVYDAVEKLGYNKKDCVFGNVKNIFKQFYYLDINAYKELTFKSKA